MITAGHCVAGEDFDNPRALQIVAGDYELYTDNGGEQVRHDVMAQWKKVTFLVLHRLLTLLKLFVTRTTMHKPSTMILHSSELLDH